MLIFKMNHLRQTNLVIHYKYFLNKQTSYTNTYLKDDRHLWETIPLCGYTGYVPTTFDQIH